MNTYPNQHRYMSNSKESVNKAVKNITSNFHECFQRYFLEYLQYLRLDLFHEFQQLQQKVFKNAVSIFFS